MPAHRIVAGGDSLDEFGFGHGLLFREIAGRRIELQRDHAQARADGLADLIDGSAASLEIRHHLGGDRGGIGRDAPRHHAMIAGEDQHRDIVEARRFAALPAPEPGGKLLEPAEASLRLGQARLAFGNRRCRAVIAFWEVCKALAQVSETGDAAHASFAIVCWPATALLAGDGVEESAGDVPAPPAARPKAHAFGIEQIGKRRHRCPPRSSEA